MRNIFLILTGAVMFLPIMLMAGEGDAQERVDLEVVVNIIDDSNDADVARAIEKANEIFEAVNIRLVVKKTNKPVSVGDGDDQLSREERDEARRNGQRELDDAVDSGKGIKIDFVTDCDTASASTNGVAVHRNPVVIIEVDDPNTMGNVIAHEIIHSLTVSGHSTDANDVMYPSTPRGTNIRPSDANEILPRARSRGTVYSVSARTVQDSSVMVPAGVDYAVDAHGAVLDEFFDVSGTYSDGTPIVPDDPSVGYADMLEVFLFADSPFDQESMMTMEIQLGGAFPEYQVDSFFDVFIDVDLYNSGPEIVLHGGVFWNGAYAETYVQWHDQVTGDLVELPVPLLHLNEEFDVEEPPAGNNHSLELSIPAHLMNLALNNYGSGSFYAAVSCHIHAEGYLPGETAAVTADDDAGPFDFDISDPYTGPQLSFDLISLGGDMGRRYVARGRNFPSFEDIEIIFGGTSSLVVSSNDKGSFSGFLPVYIPAASPVPVIARQIDDSGQAGSEHAIGYLYLRCSDADLNSDGAVNFLDMAVMAEQWLDFCIIE